MRRLFWCSYTRLLLPPRSTYQRSKMLWCFYSECNRNSLLPFLHIPFQHQGSSIPSCQYHSLSQYNWNLFHMFLCISQHLEIDHLPSYHLVCFGQYCLGRTLYVFKNTAYFYQASSLLIDHFVKMEFDTTTLVII